MKHAPLIPLFVIWCIGCQGDPGADGVRRFGEGLKTPTVELVLPLFDHAVGNRLYIEAHAEDDAEIKMVSFLIDSRYDTSGVLTLLEPPYRLVWDCSALPNGRHSIQAEVIDDRALRGYSQLLFIDKVDPASLPGSDTLRNYDPESAGDFEWTLPDNSGGQRGIGVRYNLERPGQITTVYARLRRKVAWRGTQINIDLYSSANGYPDSLIYRDDVDGTRLRLLEGETDLWAGGRIRGTTVDLADEFFILVTLADDASGDHLALLGDRGEWRNRHTVIRSASGGWRDAPAMNANNPLIYVVIEY